MYLFQVAALDDDTQKQGLTVILHRLIHHDAKIGEKGIEEDAWSANAQERQMFQRFFACTLVRCSSIHINIPSPDKVAVVVPSTIEIFGIDERVRTRLHEGTYKIVLCC